MNRRRMGQAASSWNNVEMEALTVAKYEGLGNDFLILIDLDATARYDSALARALCDRHRGIGADGLIHASSSPQLGGAFRMELLNADGSTAETSGNGMRCAVLAALHHGLVGVDEIEVETVVGKSAAQVLTASPGTCAEVRVDLGLARVIRNREHDLLSRRAFSVDVGNPHLVLVSDRSDDLDVQIIGPKLEHDVEGGQNVELATIDADRSVLMLETWERGAGYTLACGSGSCASAAAASLCRHDRRSSNGTETPAVMSWSNFPVSRQRRAPCSSERPVELRPSTWIRSI